MAIENVNEIMRDMSPAQEAFNESVAAARVAYTNAVAPEWEIFDATPKDCKYEGVATDAQKAFFNAATAPARAAYHTAIAKAQADVINAVRSNTQPLGASKWKHTQ